MMPGNSCLCSMIPPTAKAKSTAMRTMQDHRTGKLRGKGDTKVNAGSRVKIKAIKDSRDFIAGLPHMGKLVIKLWSEHEVSQGTAFARAARDSGLIDAEVHRFMLYSVLN